MKKVNILIFALILLMIKLVLSVSEPRPTITINFTEPINVSSLVVNLTNQAGDLIGLELIENIEDKVFSYKPTIDLEEGVYVVRAQARDKNGNLGNITQYSFFVLYPALKINLVQPSTGFSSLEKFDLIINTSRKVRCRYNKFNVIYEVMSEFDVSDNTLHIKYNYTLEGTQELYVRCNDTLKKEIKEEHFILVLDKTPPTIEVYADPNPVIETDLKTTIFVNSDEAVICRYDTAMVDFNSMGYKFPGYDTANYITNPNVEITLPAAEGSFNYYIGCKNKAGLGSEIKSLNIGINLAEPLKIVKVSTPEYLSSPFITLNISTNKNAMCIYSEFEDFIVQNNFDVTGGKLHTASLYKETGKYSYYVKCIKAEEVADTTIVFIVDKSPPTMKYVKINSPLEDNPGYTYRTDKLCGEWKAEDAETQIVRYYYSLYNSEGELISSGTTTNEEECLTGLELNDSEQYFLSVYAENLVGLLSEESESEPVIVDVSLTPVSCSNGIQDGDEKGIDCGGSCQIGCPDGTSCEEDSDCLSNYCDLKEGVCKKPSCDDNVKNGDESDIDCGGSCKPCEKGKSCNSDDDCITRNCDVENGVCIEKEELCRNNRLDPEEADIDCGGPCPRCEIGKKCRTHEDCLIGAECVDGICKLKPQDKDRDGIYDEHDNCPNVRNPDQKDSDNDGTGDACDPDDDNDNLPDSWEEKYYDCKTCADPEKDDDNDGLTNFEEHKAGTNPLNIDSDGDGVDDLTELKHNTDPLDVDSKPKKGFMIYVLIILGTILLGGAVYLAIKLVKPKHEEAKPVFTKPIPQPVTPRPKSERVKALERLIEKKRKEKLLQRERLFESFDEKPEKKLEKESEKPKVKEVRDVFKKLTEIAEKGGTKEERDDVFKKLSELVENKELHNEIKNRLADIKISNAELKKHLDRIRKGLE